MDSESDPITEYKSSLSDLSFNSKPLINMLTMVSEDYKDSTAAPEIVRCIEQRLHTVSNDKKLPILYLLDSICKNVGQIYVKLFAQNIVSTFCDVFEKVDEKTRLSLYELRQTWGPIFPARKLCAIDTRIHSLDPERPITAPKPEAELAKQLIQKQNQLLQLQSRLTARARALQEKEMKLKQKEHQMLRSNSPNGNKIKKRKRSQSHRSRSPSPISQKSRSPTHRWSQSLSDRMRESPQPMGRQQSASFSLRQPNPTHSPRNRSPSAGKSQFIPQQSGGSLPSIKPSVVVHSSNLLPSIAVGYQPPVPTTIPAPTILAQPEMLNISRMDPNVVTTMSSMRPLSSPMSGHRDVHSGLRTNNIDRTYAQGWGQDRDYRKEFDWMNEAHEKLRSGAITSADHDVLAREVERQLMDSTGPHSLQLDGPTPRVKLSDKRRYELWPNIINKATSEAKHVPTTAAPIPPKTSDVNTLLAKLIAAGMISNNKTETNANQTIPKEEKIESNKEKSLSTDPPIVLTSDSLKLSRPSVVAALYNGIQCTQCSQRFDDKADQPMSGDKTRYSKHWDWHCRQNRRVKAKPNSTATSMSRNWYYPLNLWVQFKEDTTGLFRTKDNESDADEELPVSTVIAEKDELLNCCAVCGEKFDLRWHEVEEEWRLNNAVKHKQKIYHPLCLNDFIAQNERTDESTESVCDIESKANVSEGSVKTEVKEQLDKSDDKCDNDLTQVLSELDVKVKSEPKVEAMETNVSEVGIKVVATEGETPVPSEPTEESNIKMIEFEIHLNSTDSELQELSNILGKKDINNVVEEVLRMESTEEKTEHRVVHQQAGKGGIAIRMKASTLPTQTTPPVVEAMETSEPIESEVMIRGQELSSLCTIL